MKPMLMNTEMVKAILAGRKTVTRRLIKPQPKNKPVFIIAGTPTKYIGKWFDEISDKYWTPPCHTGDVLYVRETWCKGSLNGGADQYFYKADDNDFHCQWRPAIHMPKEAARIFLRVIDVRVEHLKDVTLDDAIAEGCQGKFIGRGECVGAGWEILPEDEFADVWNSAIKKADLDKYGWEANPWVWVIEFERIGQEEAMKNA